MRKQSYTLSRIEILLSILLAVYFSICILLMHMVPGLLNWLGVFIFIYCIFTYKIKTGMRWFNHYTIFQLFMIMFNYGQPLMWAIGIHRSSELGARPLFKGYTPTGEDLLGAQMYTCLAILLFHFGVMCFTNRNEKIHIRNTGGSEKYSREEAKYALRKVCGLLLLIIAPVAILLRWYEVQVARDYGYIALYYGEHSTQGGYIGVLLYFFFPAIVGYLVGNDYSRKARMIAYSIFGVYAALGLLSGDRGNWIYSLVVLIWLHTFYKKTPMKTYIIYGVAGILGLYIMEVFINVRDSGLAVTGESIINVFRADNSPFINSFFEMGGSMGIITYFLKKGKEIFPYGNTYLTAIFGVISSRLLNYFGFHHVLLANWFSQEYLGISWGTGFSMIGEAFVNGGYTGGLLYMFILGCFHGRLFRFSNKISSDASPLRIFLVASGLNVMLGLIRGAVYLTLKEVFYGVFISYVLIRMVMYFRRSVSQ